VKQCKFVLAGLVLVFLLCGCNSNTNSNALMSVAALQKIDQEKRALREQQEEKERGRIRCQILADKVVKEMIYIKDERTGQCFVYFWSGTGSGGPALATVPCSSIPASMLYVGNSK